MSLMSAVMSAVTPASFGRPFGAYLRFEVRRSLRNRRYLVFTVVFPVMLYVLYTAVIKQDDSGTLDGLTWPVYFLVSMAAYGAMGAAMSQAGPIATERRGGWVEQLRVTPLPGFAYAASKLVAAVAITVPALVLVIAAAVVVDHLALPMRTMVALVATLAVAATPFAALGVALGYLLDVESAQAGQTLAFFGLAILGGLFAPIDAFPDALATIGRVMPSFHFASIGRAVVAGRPADPLDVLVLIGWTVALVGLAAWLYRRAERSTSR